MFRASSSTALLSRPSVESQQHELVMSQGKLQVSRSTESTTEFSGVTMGSRNSSKNDPKSNTDSSIFQKRSLILSIQQAQRENSLSSSTLLKASSPQAMEQLCIILDKARDIQFAFHGFGKKIQCSIDP